LIIEVKNLPDLIKKYSGWDHLVGLTKVWRFPGHRDLSLYDVLSFLFMEMSRDAINIRAAYVSFSLFISLFPGLLVAFTLIPFIPFPAFQSTILNTMQQVMPLSVHELLRETIEDIVLHHRLDLLSVSLILSIYFATNGVIGLMNSFDKTLPTFRKRGFWEKHIVAFKLLVLLSLLLATGTVLIIGGEFFIRFVMKTLEVADRVDLYFWFTALRWILIIAVFYFAISVLYFYAPAKHKRFQFFSAGSTLATFFALLVAILFSWFINNFGQYNKLYGSIGTILVAQLWIYYNSLGMLIGFELNAAIEINEVKLAGEISED
jgi:membrane protein